MFGLSSSLGMRGLAPVEVARAVGAGRHAAAAADAPVVVDHHDAVRLRPGGAGRADLHAGRVAALLALRPARRSGPPPGPSPGRSRGRRGGSRRPSPSPSAARGSSAPAGRATGCSPRRRRRRSAGSRCSARGRARRRTSTPGSGRRVGHRHRLAVLRRVLALHLVERLAQALLRHLVQAPAGRTPSAGSRRRRRAANEANCRREQLLSHEPAVWFFTGRCFMAGPPVGRGGSGAGFGASALKRGECGLWQWAHSRYRLCPFQSPVRRPWTPARQSRSFSPWHWPHSRYDSSNGTARRSRGAASRGRSASWQSRHQRCCSSCLQHDVVVHLGEHPPRAVRLAGRRGRRSRGRCPRRTAAAAPRACSWAGGCAGRRAAQAAAGLRCVVERDGRERGEQQTGQGEARSRLRPG